MTAATMICEQCTKAIPAESAGYTSTGSLLCPSCLDATQIIEADARAAAALRKVKVALGVTVALLIIVPGAMLAAGLGKMLGNILVMLGAVTATAGIYANRVARRMRNVDPLYRRGARFLVFGGMAVGVVGVPFMQQGSLPPSRPPVEWRTFTSPDADFTALFPGSPTARTTTESGAHGTITTKIYSVEYAGAEYSLMSSDRSGLTSPQVDALVDALAWETASRIGGEITASTQVWTSVIPGSSYTPKVPVSGREIRVSSRKMKVRIHVFATAYHIYRLTVAFPGVSYNDEADRFFKSFIL